MKVGDDLYGSTKKVVRRIHIKEYEYDINI
jgi:hypothetical protein